MIHTRPHTHTADDACGHCRQGLRGPHHSRHSCLSTAFARAGGELRAAVSRGLRAYHLRLGGEGQPWLRKQEGAQTTSLLTLIPGTRCCVFLCVTVDSADVNFWIKIYLFIYYYYHDRFRWPTEGGGCLCVCSVAERGVADDLLLEVLLDCFGERARVEVQAAGHLCTRTCKTHTTRHTNTPS